MSKDIHIQAFQFLGGNKGDLEKTSDNSASREWQEIVDKLASKAPNVFPTCPSQREIMQAADLSFINVPMNEPGMRAHTVYFAIQAVGGRFFFNVLCFAYHEGDVSLRELAALAPSDWWRICMQLTLSDTKLTLPEKDTELELPEWDGKKALFFRVPGFGGSVIQGEFEDWREPLNPPSPPPYQPMPSPKPKHFAPSARSEIREEPNKKFINNKGVLLIIGLLAVLALASYPIYNQSRVKNELTNKDRVIADKDQEIAELKGKLTNKDREIKKLKSSQNNQKCGSKSEQIHENDIAEDCINHIGGYYKKLIINIMGILQSSGCQHI